MASQKQREANRRNAQKSTGPKTPEGKARCARNAITHGLTATPEVDGDEAGQAGYPAKLARWIAEQRPVGDAQRALVETACRAAWRLERCARHDDAATAERVRHAADRHDAAARAEAEAIGRPLVEGPYTVRDGNHRLIFDRDEPGQDPAARVDRLNQTAQGVDWLLARWGELGGMLEREGYWQEREALAAIRLLGSRPEEVLDDPAAREVFRCARASAPVKDAFPYAMGDLVPRGARRPLSAERVEFMRVRQPGKEPAVAWLKALVERQREQLTARKASVLDARAAADRAGASEIALLEEGPSGALLVRYESAAVRALHRALADLAKLRKEEGRGADEAEPSGADASSHRTDEGDRPEPTRMGREEPACREDAADRPEGMGETDGDRSETTMRPEGVRAEPTVPGEGERSDEGTSPDVVSASGSKPEGQEGGEASCPSGPAIGRNRPDPRSVMTRIREDEASRRQARRAEKKARREKKQVRNA